MRLRLKDCTLVTDGEYLKLQIMTSLSETLPHQETHLIDSPLEVNKPSVHQTDEPKAHIMNRSNLI